MSVWIGVTLAIVVFCLAARLGFARERGFYPTVLIVIASYYLLFAVMGSAIRALAAETGFFLVFLGIAVAGFKWSTWLTIGGLAAHGIFDWLHSALVGNPGVPAFWPWFCLAFDFLLACCLAFAEVRRARHGRSFGSAHERLEQY